MACLPYPTFLYSPTRTPSALSLSAVGRVRFHPLTCPGVSDDDSDSAVVGVGSSTSSAPEEYRDIVSKCILQSQVDVSDKSNKDNAKLRKKYMKEGVAMASAYLSQTLGIDASVVDLEIVLNIDSIIETDGCLASCFLDAGCTHVVVRVKQDDGGLARALEACDATRVPRERLVLHCKDDVEMKVGDLAVVTSQVGTISIQLANPLASLKTDWKPPPIPKKSAKCVYQLTIADGLSNEDLTASVSTLSKTIGENGGFITLVDPTAEQLGLCYAACMKTDRSDGLYTTVVCTRSNEALGLVYSSKESIVAALKSGRGVYYSRSRAGLWRKGDTSGRHQSLHRLDADCDGDALRFTVTQNGDDGIKAFCHLHTLTCWGEPRGLRHLEETLAKRLVDAPEGSYTKRLFDDDQLLRDKLVEEAQELSEAVSKEHVAEELADVLYFAMVRAAKAGVSIDDAVKELDKRAKKVTRRKGDSKAFRIEAGAKILGKKG
eukprot:CAMPEP_0172551406 /NCGR_PEP_ID=MMETSP1067-20121228/39169_1 /TAXON_ID=265564 ORGANISM="Thalassiosira punctigera, Strain Tpunct2005C2" /NCGR_SAMPLE_ID=MMETSP1067 /ASSEMBLY_ACC=CAM_ASM_000444 /LENGTH=489 /DNA_ID=CAMNT_0013339191 /DNA_START=43 /DNA_END=1512 /DNA_ORIENTATION=+